MKKYLVIFGYVTAAFIAIFLLGNLLEGASLAQYAFWAPKEQAVARDVYQQTPSYVNGNTSDLRNLRDQINFTKDPDARATLQAALRDKINHLPPGFSVPSDVSAAAGN